MRLGIYVEVIFFRQSQRKVRFFLVIGPRATESSPLEGGIVIILLEL